MTTAMLIIDVQHALFDPPPRPFEADEVICRINRLARAARQASAPVVFIQHEGTDSPLAHQSTGWQLAPGLLTQPGDRLVRKTTADAFLRTDLHEVLRSSGVDHVVIAGYASEFCIDTTVRRAAALGYRVTLAADAHTTHDKPHATALAIRAHENATLPELTSFGPAIAAVPAEQLQFAA